MRLLIDANVLLDVLQNREPYVRESSIIWKLCETAQDEGFVTALSFANLVYIMRKELDPGTIEAVFKKLELIFQFTDLAAADLVKAIEMKWDDFEDSIQCAAAQRVKADYIITRNVKDYINSSVKALTPYAYICMEKPGLS